MAFLSQQVDTKEDFRSLNLNVCLSIGDIVSNDNNNNKAFSLKVRPSTQQAMQCFLESPLPPIL